LLLLLLLLQLRRYAREQPARRQRHLRRLGQQLAAALH
jgi:hypothetical protein